MDHPAETLQLSPEEQGKLLARVYAFILSDQFIGTSQESGKHVDKESAKKHKEPATKDTSAPDAESNYTQASKE